MSAVPEHIPPHVRSRAREWMIALHARSATEKDRQAFEAWLLEDPRHDRAFRDSQRVWKLLGKTNDVAQPAPPPARSREHDVSDERGFGEVRHFPGGRGVPEARRPSVWAKRLAACLTVCAVGASLLFAPEGGLSALMADVRTAAGEQRTVDLSDGTRVRLNGASALSYRFEGQRREIRLLSGEAYFQVAHDAGRPMFVDARDARIRVTGTRFDVRMTDARVVLALEEGSVVASRAGSGKEMNVRPSQQVTWQGGDQYAPVPADVYQALAWQRGRMVFTSRPLAEVVDELSRYRRGEIFVLGQAARSELVTGVFETSDPEAVLRTIERTLPVRVTRITPYLTIVH
ncbi:MAG: FecR family protein [Gammaproteobacteria bacterium]